MKRNKIGNYSKRILALMLTAVLVFGNGYESIEVISAEIQDSITSDVEKEVSTNLSYGDFNSDGNINIFDLMRSKKCVIEQKKTPSNVGDINADGIFDLHDSLLIQDHILMRNTEFSNKMKPSENIENTQPNQDNKYAYAIFAEGKENAIQINAPLITLNGKLGTNGEYSTNDVNQKVNGDHSLIENANISMMYMNDKIVNTYFKTEDEVYEDDGVYDESAVNINIDKPLNIYGDLNLDANIALNSGMMAMNDINIKGNVKNANDVVMYSKYGNINIESENINLNGLIYAPFGTVEISAENVDVNGIIIAKNVIINSECVNLTYNGSMAEFIGVDTEQMIIPYYDWSYIPDSNEDEIPDIVEEQIYEDPLSVDDEWLEDEYSSLIVEEYSAPMKKELVEVLYLSKTSKISNFTDIKDLLLMAIKGGYQKFIQLKTSINKAIKTIELNIYGYTIEVDTGDPESIYGPMPWKYYLKDETTDEDDVVSEKKKNQIFDIGIFASLIASSTLAAGTVAVEKSSEAVAGVAVALTGTVETAVNNAASAIGNTAADIAEEAKKAIEKELSKIADIDLFKIDIKETLEGYKIKILENLSIDLSKPIGGATEWVVGFTLETTGIDLKKVKNVIDLKTLENIKAVSNNIYTDIVRKIVSGDKPSEILNIVDCINTNTKEFKIAYDRLGDVDKAYEIVNKIKDGQFLGEIVKETTNYNDYKNFYGKQARIPKQSASDRQNAVDTILKNAEAGKATKGEISEAKTFQDIVENDLGTVESFRLKVFDFSSGKQGNQMGDIDVATDRFIIEVKNSSNSVTSASQFDKYTNPTNANFFNFDNKQVILYVREGGVNYSKQLFIDIQNKGVIVVDRLEKLIEVMTK